MKRRRLSGIGDFFQGFNSAYAGVGRVVDDINRRDLESQMASDLGTMAEEDINANNPVSSIQPEQVDIPASAGVSSAMAGDDQEPASDQSVIGAPVRPEAESPRIGWRVKDNQGGSNIYSDRQAADAAAQDANQFAEVESRKRLADLSPREQATAKFKVMQTPEYWAKTAAAALKLGQKDTAQKAMAKAYELHQDELGRTMGTAMFAVQMGDWDTLGKALSKAAIPQIGDDVKVTPKDDGSLAITGTDPKTRKPRTWETIPDPQTGQPKPLMPQDVMGAIVAIRSDPNQQARLFSERIRLAEQGQHDARVADRQITLERLRQKGQEDREDRRDERLQTRLDAQDKALDKRLAAQANRPERGLTAAQERGNAEIDAAREAISGLSQSEILRRSQKATNTGRENPDYDPTIAKAASLASRRKIGDDAWFDQRQGKQAQGQAPAIDRNDIASRFRADKAMNQYRLGKPVPGRGVEVMEGGRVIGYYQ